MTDDPPAQLQGSCAERLKALADPTRLEVMCRLLEGPCRVGELNERLHLEQSLLSHHLKVLRDHGLVIAERDGKAVSYRLALRPRRRGAGRVLDLGCCRLKFA